MTDTERTAMYKANCQCCLVSRAMRDCGACPFQQPTDWQAEAEAQAADYRDLLDTQESARY